MKRILAALAIVLFCASFAYGSTILRWTEAQDTENYTIGGYIVYFWTADNVTDPDVFRVPACPENITEPCDDLFIRDIENTLNLMPGKTYTFTVAAHTTLNILGEESAPVEFICESRSLPETSLPTQIYIPGPVNITIETQ
jgi:hypothetical protein